MDIENNQDGGAATEPTQAAPDAPAAADPQQSAPAADDAAPAAPAASPESPLEAFMRQQAEFNKMVAERLMQPQQQQYAPQPPAPPKPKALDIVSKHFEGKAAEGMAEVVAALREEVIQEFGTTQQLAQTSFQLQRQQMAKDALRQQGVSESDINEAIKRSRDLYQREGRSLSSDHEGDLWAHYGRMQRERELSRAADEARRKQNVQARQTRAVAPQNSDVKRGETGGLDVKKVGSLNDLWKEMDKEGFGKDEA